MKLFRHPWFLVFGLGIGLGFVAAIALALLGRGSFEQLIINLIIAVWGVPLCFVVAVVCSVIWWRQGRRWAARLTRSAVTLMIAAVIQLSAIVLGTQLADRDVAQAKAYCEKLIPQIQEYRKQKGQYPQTLAELGNLPRQPHLLRDQDFYYGHQDEFSFVVEDPSAILGVWQYNNQSQEWLYLD